MVVWTESRSCAFVITQMDSGSLDFNSPDTARYMMCAVGKIQYGLKVVFLFMHATPSHYHHYADWLIFAYGEWFYQRTWMVVGYILPRVCLTCSFVSWLPYIFSYKYMYVLNINILV